jgi:polysaccharide pyruvyl transferase WcaK-like protein
MYRVGMSGSWGGFNLADEAILEGILRELRANDMELRRDRPPP